MRSQGFPTSGTEANVELFMSRLVNDLVEAAINVGAQPGTGRGANAFLASKDADWTGGDFWGQTGGGTGGAGAGAQGAGGAAGTDGQGAVPSGGGTTFLSGGGASSLSVGENDGENDGKKDKKGKAKGKKGKKGA